jgi:RimJ/RimL family protein N-acetyltransferase
VQFHTERLVLRPARAADAAAMHAVLGDPRAMAFWSTPPHQDLEQTRDWLTSMIAIRPPVGEDFIVEFDGRLIGKAGLWRFPELGFIFHPDYWGRGLAREALEFVLDRAFRVHDLKYVKADVDPRNLGCLKLLARLSFRETGREDRTWRVGDQWCDSVYLELDAKVWKKARRGA